MSLESGLAPDAPELWNHNFQYHGWLIRCMPASCDQALDVGCGDGVLVGKMAAHAGRVTGIDVSTEMTDYARHRVHAANVDLVAGDFLAHPFQDASFDFISAVAVVHHMPFEKFAERAKSLLRPGGVLAVVGLSLDSTVMDHLVSALSTPIARVARARRGWWNPPTRQIDPVMTYSAIRDAARVLLPGVDMRRRVYFRHTLRWRKP